MNSSSKDAMSKKGKSLAPDSSANEFSKDLKNSKEIVKVIPSKSEEQVKILFSLRIFFFSTYFLNLCHF